MTTLKSAVEANERDGRLRDDDQHAIVHAYDAEKGDFASHSLEDTPYVVKTDHRSYGSSTVSPDASL
ncbi:hypothetical protein [Streptomyces sp. NPDC046727]|uniref:hypothetical protein n=1 Tax=Streptomyces sp. NPDC046727 TaxID=3155373 RepID=UPI0033CCCF56